MAEFELELADFKYLIGTASHHHLKQIAEPFALTCHRRSGGAVFQDAHGSTVSIETLHDLVQQNPEVQREAYNLFMYYAR